MYMHMYMEMTIALTTPIARKRYPLVAIRNLLPLESGSCPSSGTNLFVLSEE